jgi:hypothetical protein
MNSASISFLNKTTKINILLSVVVVVVVVLVPKLK